MMELVLSGPRNGLPGFAIGSAPPFRFSFIPALLALGERNLTLYFSISKIHARRDKRIAALLAFPKEFPQLIFMHQELACPQRSVVGIAAMLISPNVRV